MIKKMMVVLVLIALPGLMSCGNSSRDVADVADAQIAAVAFDMAFRPSGKEVTNKFNAAVNINSIEDILKQQSLTISNPALDAVVAVGLSNASKESIENLLTVIYNGILNPWTLLDKTSLNGTYGCVTWGTGVNFELQLTEAIEDYFNNNWWTLNVLTKLENCEEVSGNFNVAISGSKLGVVYSVHVIGTLTVASIPDKTFDMDITYNLENCLTEWDCVDWSGTINGYKISDIF